MRKRLEDLAKEQGSPPWMENTLADLGSSTQASIARMEYDLQIYADELKSSHSNQ